MPDDRLLSREHFLIEVNPPVCVLMDLGSTNGTKVNGLRVETAPLRDGDVITAGESAFVVQRRRDDARRACPAPLPRAAERRAPRRAYELSRRASLRPGSAPPAATTRGRHFPTTHPDYLIEKRIGGGGMGEVYLARQLSTNRPVAIKMMVPTGAASEKAKDYFRREMKVLKDLLMPSGQCHPNIVAFYDIFEIDGQFQLVMEYVAGKNALEWVDGPRRSPLLDRRGRADRPAPALGARLRALARATSTATSSRRTCWSWGPPQRPKVKLSDFGLAKSFRENAGFVGLTHQGDIGGSVGFISPDHIRDFRDVKEPADIYSAGGHALLPADAHATRSSTSTRTAAMPTA